MNQSAYNVNNVVEALKRLKVGRLTILPCLFADDIVAVKCSNGALLII